MGTDYNVTNVGGFRPATTWSNEFGDSTGWSAAHHPRLIGDVDGDGKDDIVGIKDDQVLLALSTGTSLGTANPVLSDFTFNKGWLVDQHPRLLADVDGDGQLDLVGFFHDVIEWDRLLPVRPPVPQGWETPACAATRLQPPAPDACEGPWSYTQVQRCFSVDASCPQHCTTFNSCAKWENGAVATAPAFEAPPTPITGPDTRHCSRNCRLNQDPCPFTCTGTFTQPTAACQSAATTRANDLRSQVPNGGNDIIDGVMNEQTFDSAAARAQRTADAQAVVSVTPNYGTVPENFVHQDLPGGRFLEFYDERWVCGLTTVKPAKVTAPNDACGCATFTLSACQHNCGTAALFTSPGMERPISPYISNQVCMTHDDMPQTTPAQIQAKFDALWTTLQGPPAPTVLAATFTRAMVSRLKLIYELFGDQLIDQHTSTDEVHRAISLYQSNPTDNPSCALDIDAPAPPAACTNPAVTTKFGDLIRCQRLLGTHASEATASLASTDCTALLNGYLGLVPLTGDDATCGGPHLRQVGAKTLLSLEDKQLGVINSAPTTLGGFARQLWLFDTWYTTSKAAEAAGVFTAPDQQRRDTSFLLGEFWDRVRRNTNADAQLRGLSDSSTPDQAETALGLSAASVRTAEQGVVSALFTVPPTIQPENVTLHRPPLRSLPMLAMLGDALKPLVDDLDGIAIFHDIACQFRDPDNDCRGPNTDTPSRAAWKLLADLESTTLVNDAAENTHSLAGWKDVFVKLAAQQSLFTQGVADAITGTGGLTGATAEASVHPLARPLWLLFKHARAFHDHYEATGLFESSSQPQLHGSVLQQDQHNVVIQLQGHTATLNGKITDYRNGLIAAVQAELAVMDTGARIQDLTNQRLRKAAEMDQKSHNMEGLRAAGEDEEDAFGSITASFADIQQSLDHGAFMQVGDSTTLTLTGADGRYTGGSANLADLAVHTVPGLARGQMLAIQTSGTWTPACALGVTRFFAVDGQDPIPADLSNAEIGPEGYAVTVSDGNVAAHSAGHALGFEASVGQSAKFCSSSGLIGEAIGLKLEECIFAEDKASLSATTGSSGGEEARSTASYATGLRLAGTPFTDAPAGSLLVVLADPAGNILDVKVVHGGGTSVLIPAASTAYFIVNDAKCTTAGTQKSLAVNIRTMSSAQEVADKALISMADVLDYMHQQQQALVDQGTLLPSQAVLLRQQAGLKLQAHLGEINLTSLPPPLASLFDAFVDHQIVATERRIEIRAIERSLDLDLIDLRTIDDELNAGAARARLQRLVPQWILQNFDHDTLRNDLIDLLSVSRDFLKPTLELWYPSAIPNVSNSSALLALLDADVDTSLISLAASGTSLVNDLLQAYDHGTFGAKPPGSQPLEIVLSFPRPGAFNSNVFWRRVDDRRAQRVWDAIDGHTIAHFEVTPEDFYTKNGGDAVLPCTEVIPVIKTMEVYVVRPGAGDNDALNTVGRLFHGIAGASQSFVAADGPKIYELADAAWQSYDLPVRYGESDAALSVFGATPRQGRPIGLSASGTFDLDFSVLDSLPHDGQFDAGDAFPVTEVQLIMELDSRAVAAPGASWVKRCQ
jgi:hypothetical protein